jgi:hypothetical protein
MYVVEQGGKIVIMTDGQPGAVALDMSDLTNAEGERGLLGLAITMTDVGVRQLHQQRRQHPDRRVCGQRRRHVRSGNSREVLGFDQPYPNHNGGDIDFGPDHMLYITAGDGGSGGDPDRRALNKGEWLGKILRIDPHPSADAGYTVPPDNPFVGEEGARPEIWSLGLRNPWRISFDRSTGDLWIADVGQGQWEEVDAAWAADGGGRGLNFGWSAFEGNHRFNDDQSPDGVTAPSTSTNTSAPTARSAGVPCTGIGNSGTRRVVRSPTTAAGRCVPADRRRSRQAGAVGPGQRHGRQRRADGELYAVTSDGPIYAMRLADQATCSNFAIRVGMLVDTSRTRRSTPGPTWWASTRDTTGSLPVECARDRRHP